MRNKTQENLETSKSSLILCDTLYFFISLSSLDATKKLDQLYNTYDSWIGSSKSEIWARTNIKGFFLEFLCTSYTVCRIGMEVMLY